MDKKLLSIGQAAKLIGVSIQTLRRWDSSGKLKSFRLSGKGYRFYIKDEIDLLINDLGSIAKSWVTASTPDIPQNEYYCQSSDVFEARLIRLQNELEKITGLEPLLSLIVSITGEIGNNSFDHNLGVWPDIPGIYFGYDLNKRIVVLADRGQGILVTLKRVRPGLENDEEALKTAFNEIISGRAPEARGNGLKFVREVVQANPLALLFQTGNAELSIKMNDKDPKIGKSAYQFHGCLAIINY